MIKSFIFLLCIVFVNISTASTAWVKGKEVFNEVKCFICHGNKAEKKSLNVSEVIQNWTVVQIVDALKGYKAGTRDKYGFSKMMGGKAQKLNETQMHSVAVYISSLGDSTKEVVKKVDKVTKVEFIEYVAKKDKTISSPIKVTQEIKKKPTKEIVKTVMPVKKVAKNAKITFIEYIVKKGDTLSYIAKDKYKNHLFWTLIYMQNKNILSNLNLLTIDMKLLIPSSVDMNNKAHIKLISKSYLTVYKEYKKSNRVDDARWLLYANYCHINSKILEEYKQSIDSVDLDEIKHYIKILQK